MQENACAYHEVHGEFTGCKGITSSDNGLRQKQPPAEEIPTATGNAKLKHSMSVLQQVLPVPAVLAHALPILLFRLLGLIQYPLAQPISTILVEPKQQ